MAIRARLFVALFLMVAALAGGTLPAVSQANLYPSTLQPNTVIGRTGLSAGTPQAIPFQTFTNLLAPIIGSTPYTFTVLQTFNAGAKFNTTTTGTVSASYGTVDIEHQDSGVAAAGTYVFPLIVNTYLNSPSLHGIRPGATFQMFLEQSTSNTGADANLNFYAATSSVFAASVPASTTATSSNYLGYAYGANPTAHLAVGGLYWQGVIGIDAIALIDTGASAIGRNAVQAEGDGSVRGSVWDAAYTLVGSLPWNIGFLVDDCAQSTTTCVQGPYPINAGGTILKGSLFSSVSTTLAYGIDLRAVPFSACSFAGPGSYCVDGSGNLTTGAAVRLAASQGSFPSGGNTNYGLYLGGVGFSVAVLYGTGAPTASIAAGSLYLRNDIAAVYVNTNGTTTWDQLVSLAATQTLTNKTLTSPTLGGTVTGPDSSTWTSAGVGSLVALGVGTTVPSAGQIAATGSIRTTAAGAANGPSLIVGNTTTGLYSVSTTGIGISVNGSVVIDWGISNSGFTVGGQTLALASGISTLSRNGSNGNLTINSNAGSIILTPAGTTVLTLTSTTFTFQNASNNSNILIGSAAAGYGALSMNGTLTPANMVGFFGGATGDNSFYFTVPSGNIIQFQVANSSIATVGAGGYLFLGTAGGVGYGTGVGVGGAVTQATSRTTGVTLNKITGDITLVSAAGLATYQSFVVSDTLVGATDTVTVTQKSGTDKYQIFVTAISGGTSFTITYATTGGTTTEQPVFHFNIMKGANSFLLRRDLDPAANDNAPAFLDMVG